MKVEIKERNYDVGKRLNSLIEKKLKKLDRYFGDDAVATVVCKQEKKNYIMEITISGKGIQFRSEVIGANMFENLDTALPKVEKQIIRHNEKNNERFKLPYEVPDTFSFLTEAPEFEDRKIVKRKVFDLDPITVEDAEIMLESTEHDFYVFLNAETGKVNIVYKRHDGQYGLIELKY